MSQRERNICIIQETISMCQSCPFLKESIEKSLSGEYIYWENDQFLLGASYWDAPAPLLLSSKRTVEAAFSYKNQDRKIGILNFASSINPGGGVLRGTSTKEESICRISTLFLLLSDELSAKPFYQNHQQWIH